MRLSGPLLAAVVVLALAAPAGAATIQVTTETDEYGPGPVTGTGCSLREAIAAASQNIPYGGCPAGSDGSHDTIRVPAGTFSIERPPTPGAAPSPSADGDFNITSPMTIVGAGWGRTELDGGLLDRLFYVDNPAGTVRLSSMTLQDGLPAELSLRTGGAVHSVTPVRLENLLIRRNEASGGGGVFAAGPLSVRDSVFRGNKAIHAGGSGLEQHGGAIASEDARVTILDTVLQANESFAGGGGLRAEGGAILIDRVSMLGNSTGGFGGGLSAEELPSAAANSVIIRRSTFRGNQADIAGGGINLNGNYGGLQSFPITIEHSLVAQNSAGTDASTGPYEGYGDGIRNQAVLTLSNSTITGNGVPNRSGVGGGITNAQPGTVTLRNVTVTGNRALPGGPNGDNLWNEGAIRVKNSIVGGASATGNCGGSQGLTSDGRNLEFQTGGNRCVNTPSDRIGDPHLGSLASNGGPTRTRALRPGSPAINRGSGCPAVDQRGVPRSLGGACDIGAYELVRCRGVVVNRVGTGGTDVLRGTRGADGLLGLGGPDRLVGRGAGDGLCGGAGRDTLIGGAGNDACSGGPGLDGARACERRSSIP